HFFTITSPKMLSANLNAPNQITLTSMPPGKPGPGEVLLRILHAGVCGTDIALYRGYYPVPLPLVLGHEFSARVEAVGPDVDPNWKGKRVACEINNSCRAYNRADLCEACRR